MRIHFLLPLTLAFAPVPCPGQSARAHDGLYLSVDVGPAWGAIRQSAVNAPYPYARYSGTGTEFDFHIGGAVAPGELLSFDISTMTINDPTVAYQDTAASLGRNVSIGDAIFGLGYTHYFMPADAFVGVTAGPGRFTLTGGSITGGTRTGMGAILRAGKEWRIGSRWGMGLVGGVAWLKASDQSSPALPGYSSTFRTTRTFLGVCATFG
jgi:hypothetical protein